MIELTPEQVRALERPGTAPSRIVNPKTHEAFALVPWAEYERSHPQGGNGAALTATSNGSGDEEKSLAPEQIEEKLIDLIHREPFVPFVVEMKDGQRLVIPHGRLAIDHTGAVFVGSDGGLVDFDFKTVCAFHPFTAEATL